LIGSFPSTHCPPTGRLVRSELTSRWRDRPIDTIGKRDVIGMLEDIQERSGAAMARQSLTYARRLFGWAVGAISSW
jgi:hypothetical protein